MPMLNPENLIIQIMRRTGRTYEEARDILSCFGYEVDDRFVPIVGHPNGHTQIGMTPKEFAEQFNSLLEVEHEKVPVVSVRSSN